MKHLHQGEVVRLVDRYIRPKCRRPDDILDAARLARRLSRETSVPRRQIADAIIERAMYRQLSVRW